MWTRSDPVIDGGYGYAAAWSPDLPLAVVVGDGRFGGFGLATAPDAVNWTQYALFASYAGFAAMWVPPSTLSPGGEFVVGGAKLSGPSTPFHTSPDGSTWTDRTTGVDQVYGLACNDTLAVAVGYGSVNQVATSSDLATWTGQGKPLTGGTARFTGLIWIDSLSLFIGTTINAFDSGTFHHIVSSPDGVTWTDESAAAPGTQAFSPLWIDDLGALFYQTQDGGIPYIGVGTSGLSSWNQLDNSLSLTNGLVYSPDRDEMLLLGNAGGGMTDVAFAPATLDPAWVPAQPAIAAPDNGASQSGIWIPDLNQYLVTGGVTL